MALANYKYVSNAGTTYQVTLPVDFAVALGLTVASGSEPYLDANLSPRYATYLNTTVGRRAAVIGTTTAFGSLPTTLTVGSNVYTFQSAIGELIPPYLPASLFAAGSIQGPQGPAGAGIPLTAISVTLGADFTMTTAGTTYSPLSISLTAGVWLIMWSVLVQTSSAISGWTNVPTVGPFQGGSILVPTGGVGLQFAFNSLVTVTSSVVANLNMVSNVNSTIIKGLTFSGSQPASNGIGIKIG